MNKLTLLLLLFISHNSFLQDFKYRFSIEGIQDSYNAKIVMDKYLNPFFKITENQINRLKFYQDSSFFKVETVNPISVIIMENYFIEKAELKILNFRED